jgi:hypothetical protein
MSNEFEKVKKCLPKTKARARETHFLILPDFHKLNDTNPLQTVP